MNSKFQLFCDGGSRGNPGKSACGFVVFENDEIVFSKGKYLGVTTNNVAEWQGLIEGLKYFVDSYDLSDIELQVSLDSKLVVEQINRKWQVKQEHLKVLFGEANTLKMQFSNIKIQHILRHLNKDADAIVNQTLDES